MEIFRNFNWKRGRGWGFFTNRIIEDGGIFRDKSPNGETGPMYGPASVSVPARGLIFRPVRVRVPIPVGGGNFSPLRGGAPTGTGFLA